MTTTPSHQAGNSRRDQLVASLVVGGVLVALGAASGLGIAVSSGAAAAPRLPSVNALGSVPGSTAPTTGPVNYIGTPGPGNLPTIYPGGIVAPSTSPVATSTSPAAASGSPSTPTPTPTSGSPTPSATPTPANLSCPADVVVGLLDLILGNKGLLSGSGLLKTVLNLLPNLASLLKGAGLSSVLATNTSDLSSAQANSMAQACTPVLSGLLSGGTA